MKIRITVTALVIIGLCAWGLVVVEVAGVAGDLLSAEAFNALRSAGIVAPVCAAMLFAADVIARTIRTQIDRAQQDTMDRMFANIAKGKALAEIHATQTWKTGPADTGPFPIYDASLS